MMARKTLNDLEETCIDYVKSHPEGYCVDKHFYVKTEGVLISCKGINSKKEIYDILSLTIKNNEIIDLNDFEGDFRDYLIKKGFESALPKK